MFRKTSTDSDQPEKCMSTLQWHIEYEKVRFVVIGVRIHQNHTQVMHQHSGGSEKDAGGDKRPARH